MSINIDHEQPTPWQGQLEIIKARVEELNHHRQMEQTEYAEFLNITYNVWQQWTRKNKPTREPKREHIYSIHQKTGIELQWLITGEGEPFAKANEGVQEDVADYGDSIDSLTRKAWVVLSSGTVYASALSANIDAFHQAVMADKVNDELKKFIKSGCSQKGEVEIGQAG